MINNEAYDKYFVGRDIRFAMPNYRQDHQKKGCAPPKPFNREWWEAAGAEYNAEPARRFWSDEEDEDIKALFATGMTLSQMARRLRRSRPAMDKRLSFLRARDGDIPKRSRWDRTGGK